MRLSHTGRWIYFANPKCGSRTVCGLLDPFSVPGLTIDQEPRGPLPIHFRAADLRAKFAEIGLPWGEYFKFTTVRNPWAKTVSLFEYEKRIGRLPPGTRFKTWLMCPEAMTPVEHRAKRAQCWSLPFFVGDDEGQYLVDAVVRTEAIDVELPPILKRLGLPIPRHIPVENVTPHDAYAGYYDIDTQAIVHTLYAAEIERFGYVFGA